MSQQYNLGKVALTPRGAYSSTTTYQKLDVITYNGSSYIVLQSCTGQTPPNETYYQVIASKGNAGTNGSSATIAAGTVTMLPVGSPATVTNSGTSGNAIFDFGIPYSPLADGSVNTANLANYAVTDVKLADDSVTTPKLADESVTLDKLAADTIAELDNKADIDGSYESMTVGNAEQLVSSVGIEDQTPYNFRTSGGSTEIGDREELNAVVGATVAWNQLVPTANRDFTSESSDTRALFFVLRKSSSPYTTLYQKQNVAVGILSSVVASSFDGYAEMTHSGSQRNIRITPVDGFRLTNGHKYLFSLNFTSVDTSTVGGVVAKDISVYDLTALFGASIADYIYALEQSNAGAGVAYFRKLFPKPYYAYNSGELLSVRTNLHRMVGFNQWDKTNIEDGYVNDTTGLIGGTNTSKNTGYIRVVGGLTYHVRTDATSGRWGAWYDSDKNYISAANPVPSGNMNITAPQNAAYLRSTVVYQGNGNPDTFCINLSWDGERDGEYEPYQEWNYPLDSLLTLRGILKLDANNNLYADGDRYMPDGTVERRYGVVDLGTLSWQYITTSERNFFRCTVSGIKQNSPVVCGKYPYGGRKYDSGMASADDKAIYIPYNSTFVYVKDSAYTDDAAFKTAMSGVYLVYELATPTTESAAPYQQTQIVDDFGTEEFVDAAVEANERDVAIPVGNETVYKPNLRAKLEMAPDSPDGGDGDYIVRQTNGTNEYANIASNSTISGLSTRCPACPTDTDGNFVLKATVSGGSVTYSWVSA